MKNLISGVVAAVKNRYSLKNMIARSQHQVGATAIEYGLIAAGLSVAIIAVVQGLGTQLKSTFDAIQHALN